jgi:hypothetical protein
MRKLFNKKVLIVLLAISIIGTLFVSSVFADTSVEIDPYNQAREFINNADNPQVPFQKAWKDLKPIAEIVMGIGLVVLVCVGSILGIKYMTAGVDDKAKVKQKLIWYCVAAALVVGATGIFNIVVDIASMLA